MINAYSVITVLYTQKFERSVGIFRVFLTVIPLTALALDYVPRAFADTKFVLQVNVVRVLLTALLLVVLIRLLGLPGAAMATILAIGITKAIILRRVKGLFNTSITSVLPCYPLAKISGAAVLAGIGSVVIQVALSVPVTECLCGRPM
jgi:Na+-driven multidrug efflux pump